MKLILQIAAGILLAPVLLIALIAGLFAMLAADPSTWLVVLGGLAVAWLISRADVREPLALVFRRRRP